MTTRTAEEERGAQANHSLGVALAPTGEALPVVEVLCKSFDRAYRFAVHTHFGDFDCALIVQGKTLCKGKRVVQHSGLLTVVQVQDFDMTFVN